MAVAFRKEGHKTRLTGRPEIIDLESNLCGFQCNRSRVWSKSRPEEKYSFDERIVNKLRMAWGPIPVSGCDQLLRNIRFHSTCDQIEPEDRWRTVPAGRAMDVNMTSFVANHGMKFRQAFQRNLIGNSRKIRDCVIRYFKKRAILH